MATVKIRLEGINNIEDAAFTIDEGRVPGEALERIGAELVKRIKSRTRAGADVSGQAFEPYSKEYEKKRKKEGKPTTPDLNYTGDMLKGLTVKTDEERQMITLYFRDPAEAKKAHYHNEAGAGKNKTVRKFFALSYPDKVYLQSAIAGAKIKVTEDRFGKLA